MRSVRGDENKIFFERSHGCQSGRIDSRAETVKWTEEVPPPFLKLSQHFPYKSGEFRRTEAGKAVAAGAAYD